MPRRSQVVLLITFPHDPPSTIIPETFWPWMITLNVGLCPSIIVGPLLRFDKMMWVNWVTNFNNPVSSNDIWQSTKTFHASSSSGALVVTFLLPTCRLVECDILFTTLSQYLGDIIVIGFVYPLLNCLPNLFLYRLFFVSLVCRGQLGV